MKSVRAKKHLGQHFLNDERISERIARLLTGHGGYTTVLEIGPGMGVLTKYLLQDERFTTHVIEIDTESVAYLKEYYPTLRGRIIEGDFLKIGLRGLNPTSDPTPSPSPEGINPTPSPSPEGRGIDHTLTLQTRLTARGEEKNTLPFGGRDGDGVSDHSLTLPSGEEKNTLPLGGRDGDGVSDHTLTLPSGEEKNTLPFGGRDGDGVSEEVIAIIGNFPYNISSQIFFSILEHRNRVAEVVCMLQKEVAQRIASPPGNKDYGILSVLLQAFYTITYEFTVYPGSFNPPPKVDSGVIRLQRNEVTQLPCDEKLFFSVVKIGFNQRRKMLRNPLKALGIPLEHPFLEKRAEQLSVADFIELTQAYQAARENQGAGNSKQ